MCPPALVAAAIAIAVVGAAASITATEIAAAKARGDHEEAMRLRNEAASKYNAVDLAHIDRLVAEQLGETELSSIKNDPSIREAQMSALEKFKTLMNNNGEDAQSRMAFMKAQSEAGRVQSGMEGRLQQQMAQRGLAGSGMEYAGQLQTQQAGLQRASEMQTQAAADSANRAFGAAQQAGGLAGSIRGQDYQQASDRAKAQDSINRFNAEARDSAGRFNNMIDQMRYDNQLKRLAGETGQMQLAAEGYDAEGRRKLAQGQQEGAAINAAAQSSASAVAGAGGGSYASQPTTTPTQPTTAYTGYYSNLVADQDGRLR